MESYQVPFVDTPDTTRTVYNSRTGTYRDRNQTITITLSVTGGVMMDTPNNYLAGLGGLQQSVIGENHWVASGIRSWMGRPRRRWRCR